MTMLSILLASLIIWSCLLLWSSFKTICTV